MLCRAVATAAFLVWITPALAYAQEDVQAAAAAFAEAQRAQLRGDFPRAAELFEIADQAAPSPAALRSAIRNREAAGQNVRAATLSLRAIARYPEDRETRRIADATIEKLAPQLVRVRVTCDVACQLAVDGGAVGTAATLSNEFFVGDGPHTLEARWPGRDAVTRPVEGALGQTVVLDLQAPAPRPAAPAAQPGPSAADPMGPAPGPAPASGEDASIDFGTTDKSREGMSPAVFWAGAGLTVVAGGLLTWSALDTLDARDDYEVAPTREKYDDGLGLQRRTNILAGATAALGAVTVAIGLFATDWGGKASASIGPHHATLSFKGRLP